MAERHPSEQDRFVDVLGHVMHPLEGVGHGVVVDVTATDERDAGLLAGLVSICHWGPPPPSGFQEQGPDTK
jgi:hypothetical protein